MKYRLVIDNDFAWGVNKYEVFCDFGGWKIVTQLNRQCRGMVLLPRISSWATPAQSKPKLVNTWWWREYFAWAWNKAGIIFYLAVSAIAATRHACHRSASYYSAIDYSMALLQEHNYRLQVGGTVSRPSAVVKRHSFGALYNTCSQSPPIQTVYRRIKVLGDMAASAHKWRW